MGHGHSHSHGPVPGAGPASTAYRGRLRTVLLITLGVVVAEVVGAALSGSLALWADAAHMAADAAGLAVALLATHLAHRPPTMRRTFGYQRAEVLAALGNATLLLVLAGAVGVQGIERLLHPATVRPGIMLAFGVLALAANSASLLLLRRGQAPRSTSGARSWRSCPTPSPRPGSSRRPSSWPSPAGPGPTPWSPWPSR